SGAAAARGLAGGVAPAGVPAPLVVSTAQAATVAAGHAVVAGAASVSAPALVPGGGKAMLTLKASLAVVLLPAAPGARLGAGPSRPQAGGPQTPARAPHPPPPGGSPPR